MKGNPNESISSNEIDSTVCEFKPQYANVIRELGRTAMIDAGIDSEKVELYLEDEFDYSTIPEVYSGRSRLWVARVGNKVVGTVAIVEIDQETARLRRMFVSPGSQGKGVGQQLLDAALKFAVENGYEEIVLDTDSIMYKAQNLYEKNGFRRVREEEDRVFYEKKLV